MLLHVTCSLNGAHFRSGAIRPAASAITATLHLGQQLGVLVGTAPVQQASVAVPTTGICKEQHITAFVKLTVLHGIGRVCGQVDWQQHNQKVAIIDSDFPLFRRWRQLLIVIISYL